jgi:hypothetical protein
MKKSGFIVTSVIFAALLYTAALQAQVTYETSTTSRGFLGMGGFTATSKIMIQGDARRQENQMQFTGTIMKHLSPKGTTVDITRLDKELFWNFNDKDKKYTETTFAEYKKLFEEGKMTMPMPGQEEEKPADQQEYEWQEPVVKVKDLGDQQKINNFSCKHYLVTVTTIGKHKATGKLDTLLVSADMFNSVNVGKAMKQISDFDLRLLKALGLDKLDNSALQMVAARYALQMKKLAEEMRKIEGYPVRTEMLFTMTTHAMAAQKPAETAEKEEESTPPTDVKGALGGMFGKKLKEMAKAKAAKSEGDPNRKELYQSVHELVTIAVGDVPADQFEVPAGYKLQERKQR